MAICCRQTIPSSTKRRVLVTALLVSALLGSLTAIVCTATWFSVFVYIRRTVCAASVPSPVCDHAWWFVWLLASVAAGVHALVSVLLLRADRRPSVDDAPGVRNFAKTVFHASVFELQLCIVVLWVGYHADPHGFPGQPQPLEATEQPRTGWEQGVWGGFLLYLGAGPQGRSAAVMHGAFWLFHLTAILVILQYALAVAFSAKGAPSLDRAEDEGRP